MRHLLQLLLLCRRTRAPVSSMSMSPTTISLFLMTQVLPLRTTLTSITSFCALSFLNCRSFW